MKKTLLSLLFLCAGCGGFKQTGSPSFGGDDNAILSDVNYQLMVQTGPFQGRLVVDQIRNSSIKILIPVGMINSVPTGNFSSSQWKISGNIVADPNGFRTAEVFIPVSHISRGVNSPLVSTLPNGENLDFIASGQAQHFSFPIDIAGNVQIHVYISAPYLIGVFIQTPFDLANSNKYLVTPVNGLNEMGFFSTHPHRPPLNGGPFVFISLPR